MSPTSSPGFSLDCPDCDDYGDTLLILYGPRRNRPMLNEFEFITVESSSQPGRGLRSNRWTEHDWGHRYSRPQLGRKANGGIEGQHRRHLESRRDRRWSIPPTATPPITAAGGTCYTRLGLVHRKLPPVVLLFVEPLDRRLGLIVGLHLDEGEAFAAARGTILDDLVLCTVPYWPNHCSRSEWVTE